MTVCNLLVFVSVVTCLDSSQKTFNQEEKESNFLVQSKFDGKTNGGNSFHFDSSSKLLMPTEKKENTSEFDDIFKDIITLVANSIQNMGKQYGVALQYNLIIYMFVNEFYY